MATTNLLHVLNARDAQPLEGTPAKLGMEVGPIAGTGFPPNITSGAFWFFRLPATAALATGATLKLLVAESPLNPDEGASVAAGARVARFGVTFGEGGGSTYLPINPATNTDMGTEAAVDIVIPVDAARPTTGKVNSGSVAVVVANMGAAVAAGDWVVCKIRRLGDHVNDTHSGWVVLLDVDVRDT